MASVYKRKQDRHKQKACWYFSFKDENGKWRTRKGFTDKRRSEQLAAKMEGESMLRRTGLIDSEQERVQQERTRPIEEHLVAFERHQGTNTPKHVQLTLSRIRRVLQVGNVNRLSELDAETGETALAALEQEKRLSPRTINHYLSALGSFCNWAVNTNRLPSNPLASLALRNTEVDIRKKRRTLSPDEFSRLLESTRTSEVEIQCYDGETRARIYLLGNLTGLRQSEIASLTPLSFDLEADPATLTIEAKSSKHRRKDILPLHPHLIGVLPGWLEGIPADQPLFPRLAKRRTWLMIKKDLERAGIPYQTEEGTADFHAVGRHTHITELLRNGASLVEARELARHSDIRMTMRYTHIGLDDQARAVAAIPAPRTPQTDQPEEESWEYIGSKTCGEPCHLPSSAGNTVTMELATVNDENPCGDRGLDAVCPPARTRTRHLRQLVHHGVVYRAKVAH